MTRWALLVLLTASCAGRQGDLQTALGQLEDMAMDADIRSVYEELQDTDPSPRWACGVLIVAREIVARVPLGDWKGVVLQVLDLAHELCPGIVDVFPPRTPKRE